MCMQKKCTQISKTWPDQQKIMVLNSNIPKQIYLTLKLFMYTQQPSHNIYCNINTKQLLAALQYKAALGFAPDFVQIQIVK